MAKKDIYVDMDINQQEIIESQFENTAAPTFDGHEVFDTAGGRRHIQVGGTQETYAFLSDLGGLNDAFIGANLVGSDLIFNESDGGTVTIDLSSFLDDTNLGRVVSGALSGTDLELTRDDATIVTIDVSGLVGALSQTVTAGNEIAQYTPFGGTPVPILETVTGLSIAGNVLSLAKEDGTTDDIDLSLYLDDTNLARLVSGTIDGVTGIATFTRDDASTFTVDFSALFDDTNLARITSGALTGTDLNLTRDDASVVGPIDLSALDQSADIAAIVDDHVTGATLNGANELVLTMAQGGSFTVPLAGLLDDTNLARLVSGSLAGSALTLTRDDATDFTVDLSGLLDDTNLARITSGATSGSDLILTRDDASTITIDLSAFASSPSSLTAPSGSGNVIATHDDGTGNTVDIEETITSIEVEPSDNAIINLNDESGGISSADMSPIAFMYERQTVNLVANTPLTVSATGLLADIYSIQTYDSAGDMITVAISKGGSNNQRVLESNVSLTGVVVEMTGSR